jgi:hypothetical protein
MAFNSFTAHYNDSSNKWFNLIVIVSYNSIFLYKFILLFFADEKKT